MKKITKKIITLIVSVMMIAVLLPVSAFAANWNPTDVITINVRVFDQSTGKTYDVGTDSVTKGDVYIQSDPYQIPSLKAFTSNEYGRITKVVGNWYFPSGDSNVGATVYWSCNVSSVTMTYWVTDWSTGSGTGGNTSETIDLGGSGKNTINFTINYHSNYPDGTDYVVRKSYTVKSYVSIRNIFSNEFLTYTACGFGGYDLKASERTWYKQPECSSTWGNIGATNGGTYDLYAGWADGGTPVTPVTLTFMDDSTKYAAANYFAGDTAVAVNCDTTKDGYVFKGWDTDSAAQTVVYKAGDAFVINTNTTLYAVWEKVAPQISFRGAAIRVPETYDYQTEGWDNTAALSKTNLRFGYVITLPEGMTMDDIAWSWNWGTDKEDLNKTVVGKEYIDLGNNTYRTNLVITNIPTDTAYATDIHSQLTLTYTKDGEEATIVDPVQTRSVKFVAEAIKAAMDKGTCNETDRVQNYVRDLINKVNE